MVACGSCGGGQSAAPQREFVYKSPTGKETIFDSETEAKIQISIDGGGSYTVRAKKSR